MAINLEESWLSALEDEFTKPYMTSLKEELQKEKTAGKTIYPPSKLIFHALELTPVSKVKVVILGQDPYHGPGQAHGLSFSVPPGVPSPPSLKNIFKELADDLQVKPAGGGDLTSWAQQGVLLLNSVLTVRAGEPGSHRKLGWESFTDRVIGQVANGHPCVFILWGAYARSKKNIIDQGRHLVIESAHPSPFSADRFFGSRPFSQTNEWLSARNVTPVMWGESLHLA